MMDQSCRTFIAGLADAGEVLDVPGVVALDGELAAIIGLLDDGPAVRIYETDSGTFPVFGNILNSVARIGKAIGCETQDVISRIADASRARVATKVVTTAPAQDVVLRAEDHEDLLSLLPIPKFFEYESGPYITAGLICAHEPQSGMRNASYARIKPLGLNRAFVGIAPNHHLMALAREASKHGAPLDITVSLGSHPAIQLASCLYLGLGDDELEHAAELLGEPVRVVEGVTVNARALADAEIVIEARLHIDRPVEEGLVSEYHGMYEDYGPGIEVEITAITHRKNAWYQVILPGLFSEHALLGALPIGAGLVAALSEIRIEVHDLAVTKAGGGRVNVVIAVKNLRPGVARRAFFTCWSKVSMVKQITLVDADVNVWDYEHVEWARTARMRWDEDVLVVPQVVTDRNEPMQEAGVVAKVGLDATMKPGRRRAGWDRALPAPSATRRAAQRLTEAGAAGRVMPGIGLDGPWKEYT